MLSEKASFCFQPNGSEPTIVFLSDSKPNSFRSKVVFSLIAWVLMP